jgi:hypothetical protein
VKDDARVPTGTKTFKRCTLPPAFKANNVFGKK